MKLKKMSPSLAITGLILSPLIVFAQSGSVAPSAAAPSSGANGTMGNPAGTGLTPAQQQQQQQQTNPMNDAIMRQNPNTLPGGMLNDSSRTTGTTSSTTMTPDTNRAAILQNGNQNSTKRRPARPRNSNTTPNSNSINPQPIPSPANP